MVRIITLLTLCLLTAPVAAQDRVSPDDTLAKLKQEVKAKSASYRRAYQAAKSSQQRALLSKQEHPEEIYELRFMDFAKKHPKTSAARRALMWVSQRGYGQSHKAIEALVTEFSKDPAIHEAFAGVYYHPDARGFYDKILSQSPHKKVQALATYWLARALSDMSDYSRLSGDDHKKALTLLGKAKGEFQELLTATKRQHLNQYLFKLKYLQIGHVAPDIKGQDVDGRSFKLSDYRGKVVMLVFWGDW
jgi:hypothetical protein